MCILTARFSPACICLQETMVGDATPPGPRGYHAIYSAPFHGQGRHSILGLTLHYRQFLYNCFSVDNTHYANVCLPPSVPVERDYLDHLVNDLTSPFLLLGDMNGRHSMGCLHYQCTRRSTLTLSRGKGVRNSNSGDMTSFHIQTGTFTAVDVSFCSLMLFQTLIGG